MANTLQQKVQVPQGAGFDGLPSHAQSISDHCSLSPTTVNGDDALMSARLGTAAISR
jgi:hypothetical protein